MYLTIVLLYNTLVNVLSINAYQRTDEHLTKYKCHNMSKEICNSDVKNTNSSIIVV